MAAVATAPLGLSVIGPERWICTHCAFTSLLLPGKLAKKSCPDCGAADWYHTVDAVPGA